jgi:glyoxylase-like metal-dependent hydrolase (beta-lactamase superfamily II)
VSDRNVSPDSGQHWADEGAWPAAPGVHRIPLPLPTDGLRAVNVYAIETDEGLTLVDGGWAIEAGRAALDKGLAQIGYAASDIRRFLVTHVHRDHYTQAVVVRREFGSRIALGLADKPTLDRVHEGTDDNRIAALLRDAGAADLADRWVRLVDGPGPDLSHWGYPDEWLEDDVDLAVGARTLRALATPGHTRGHYVFAEPDAGLLFAGDHVLPTITPSIGFEPVPASLPLGDFLSSLAKVRAMPDALLLPAHGPVAPSVHARVDELLAHHDDRLTQCRNALAPGGRSAHDVAARLTWTRHEHPLADLDTFNQTLAVLETRAHLELLVARGDAVAVDTADGRAYAPVSPGPRSP